MLDKSNQSYGCLNIFTTVMWMVALVVFDKAMSKAMVLSPLNTLMSANQMSFTDSNTKKNMVTFDPPNTIDTISACSLFSSAQFWSF